MKSWCKPVLGKLGFCKLIIWKSLSLEVALCSCNNYDSTAGGKADFSLHDVNEELDNDSCGPSVRQS